MGNTNFQTIYPMGGIVNGMVKQATGREPVDNLDMDYVTVAQNTVVGELEFTGDVVQFNTGRSVPIRKLEVSLEPVQSGSGDPSPENVRPISGWDAVNVYRSGRNLLFNYTVASSAYGMTGVVIQESGGGVRFTGVPTWTTGNNRQFRIAWASTVKSLFGNIASIKIFCDSEYCEIVRASFGSTDNSIVVTTNTIATTENLTLDFYIMVYIGDEPTEFIPYTGETITTEFPTPPGTVYGGKLDVVSGKLTVDRVMIDDFTGFNYLSVASTTDTIANAQIPLAISGLPAAVVGEIISNRFSKNIASGTQGRMVLTASVLYFAIAKSEMVSYDKAGVLAWLADHPTQFCYKMAVPVEYQLTPQEVNTLVGDNTIYSDAGTVDVMYWVYKEMF